MRILNNLLFIIILNILVLVVAIYFATEFGFGLESEPTMATFINLIEKGVYGSSRYYGQPVSEIFLGFFAYYFGGKFTNFICFCLFNLSIYFFYFTFHKDSGQKNTILFLLLLCFSNSLIFLQSTDVSDFPVALFFLSLGFFLFKKNEKYISIIIFSLCVASRSHFLLYILTFICFEMYMNKLDIKENLKYILLLFFVSSLFYLPMFYSSKLSLSFISNTGGVGLNFSEMWPRFIYKTYMMVGVFSSIFIFILITLKIKFFINILIKEKILFLLIIVNLVTFFSFPTKYALLQPFLIFLYLVLSKYVSQKIIFIIIALNIFEWFFSYQLIEIKYKYADICLNGNGKQAIGAIYNPKISKGNLSKHYDNLPIQKCWASVYYAPLGREEQYLNGSQLKIK